MSERLGLQHETCYGDHRGAGSRQGDDGITTVLRAFTDRHQPFKPLSGGLNADSTPTEAKREKLPRIGDRPTNKAGRRPFSHRLANKQTINITAWTCVLIHPERRISLARRVHCK